MSHPLSKLLPTQDNMSKLLPAVPDMDTQLQLAAKMIDKKTATHKVRPTETFFFFILFLFSVSGTAQLWLLLPGVFSDGRIQSSVETKVARHLLYTLS